MRPGLTQLWSLLENHNPTDKAEWGDLLKMRELAVQLAQPFARTQPIAHFTGSALVLDEAWRTCLVHHRRIGRWLQPGGHAEPADGNDPQRTAAREASEETGLHLVPHPALPGLVDVDVHVINASKGEPEHLHLDLRFMLLATNPGELKADPAETHGARWLDLDEAVALAADPGLLRLLNKARALRPVRH